MKLKLIGLFFFLIAASAPYASKAAFPNFLYASAITTGCFWIGFIFILRPIGREHHLNSYLRWANYAVLIHIVLTIILNIYFYIFFLHYEIRNGIGIDIFIAVEHIANPIKYILGILVPPHTVEQSDGSVLIYQSFVRSILSTFFNLVFVTLLGVIAKIVKDNFPLHSSGNTAALRSRR